MQPARRCRISCPQRDFPVPQERAEGSDSSFGYVQVFEVRHENSENDKKTEKELLQRRL